MEVRTTPEVENLFSKYETLSQQSDYGAIAKLYGGKLIAAGPKGITFHSNNFITRWQFDKTMREFYRKAGLSTIRIVRLHETRISDQYSLVDVTWIATFNKTESQQIEFHISYIVRKRRNKVDIVMFIAREDESKILQGYGILP